MNYSLLIWLSLQIPMREELKIIDQDNPSSHNILVLGDSHMVGDFGEYFHRELHNLKKYNVVSIGIGGAGSYHFTVNMRAFCCGAIIRETCWFDSISPKQTIPVTERHYGGTNAIVGKFFKGKLSNYIKHYEPDFIIVALGSNYTNAHEELVEILQEGNPLREIIWVGPMRRSNIEARLYAIDKVIKKHPHIRFIPSEDIIGHDTISSIHYAGKSARYWAQTVVKRMDFFLN